ncbi:MAG TPA: hypothetical protein VH206_09855 [Xanthobacteraceae bacterium]|jgi:hypothetical protein|nr:hypothetical protein [Xanthobacteraceae bacterium]
MPPDPNTHLGQLLIRLEDWMPIPEFVHAMDAYYKSDRPDNEVKAIRAKSNPAKKLRDEIGPVLHHVKFMKAIGDVRFPQDNDVPDCWLRASPHGTQHGVEVTCALAREQALLGKRMNTRGIVPGFLGVPDDAPQTVFEKKLERGRIMHSTDGVLRAVCESIKACLRNKNNPKYQGHDLLVEANLTILPNERWSLIENELQQAVQDMPFRQIHVIGDQDKSLFGFRIK